MKYEEHHKAKIRVKLFLSVIAVLLLIQVEPSYQIKEWWEDSKAMTLNSSNFFDVVGSEKFVFVKFFTKWCKFCKLMAPDFELLIEEMATKRDDIIIARLEGNSSPDITMNFGINSFPTLILFEPHNKDFFVIYNERNRNKDTMASFLENYAEKIEEDFISTEKEEAEQAFLKQIPSSEDTINEVKPSEMNAIYTQNTEEIPKEFYEQEVFVEAIDQEEEDLISLRKRYLSLSIKYKNIKEDVALFDKILNSDLKNEPSTLDIFNNEISKEILDEYRKYYQIDKIKINYRNLFWYVGIFLALIFAMCMFFRVYNKMIVN
mmetsp:Transcript_11339/g.11655  ORF Transcript_11339/g.11655 Transcript_11339/m.11655 type:complete len:319 (+) Transcript_11339:21-977(+)